MKTPVVWWARIWKRFPNKPLCIFESPTSNLVGVAGAGEFDEIEVVPKAAYDMAMVENAALKNQIADLTLLLNKARKS